MCPWWVGEWVGSRAIARLAFVSGLVLALAAPPVFAQLGPAEGPLPSLDEDPEPPPLDEPRQIGQPLPPRATEITFDLPIEGGGRVSGTAGALEFQRDDYVLATEGVRLEYQNVTIQAEWMAVDLTGKKVTAEHNVILDEGPRRLAGETLEWDLDTQTGTLFEATGFVDPDIYFRGSEVSKVDEDTYTVRHAMFTSCDDEVPKWSFRAGKTRLTIDGYARASNVNMRAKKVPFLYFPWMMYPVKAKRTSGVLVPNVGFSQDRGSYLGLAYYQTMGDRFDDTVFVDLWVEDYVAVGNEFRYAPTYGTSGIFTTYAVDDPIEDELRWKLLWNHESRGLPGGFRGIVKIAEYSDFNWFRDFERNFNLRSSSSIYSSGYLSGNWGSSSLNILTDRRETFSGANNSQVNTQLPEVEYRLRQTQIGRLPLYFQLQNTTSYLERQRTGQEDREYGRIDLFPTLTIPIRSLTWLEMSLEGGARTTWYEKSIDPETGELTGSSITRTLTSARAEIVGPSFSRVYNKAAGPFGKFMHVVEPRWTYFFASEYDDQNLIPGFDEIDPINPTNRGAFQFINRLMAKPREGRKGNAREIMSMELRQDYSFDADKPLQRSRDGEMTKQESPIAFRFRFNPSRYTSLQSQATYNTIYYQLNNMSVTGSTNKDRFDLGLTWYMNFDNETGETLGNQVRFATAFDIVRRRLNFAASVSLDLGPKGMSDRETLQQQRYILSYTGQCYGLRFEMTEYNFDGDPQRDFRFAFSLKNVGTFLDLTAGDSTYRRGGGFSGGSSFGGL